MSTEAACATVTDTAAVCRPGHQHNTQTSVRLITSTHTHHGCMTSFMMKPTLARCPFCLERYNNNTPFTRYNRLSTQLYSRFDNRLYRVNKHQTGCQTGMTTSLTNVLNEQPLFVQHGCQTGLYNPFDNRLYTRYSRLSNRCQTGLTTS